MNGGPLLADVILLNLISGHACYASPAALKIIWSHQEGYLGDDFDSSPKMLVICQTGTRDLDGFTKLCNWTHPMLLFHQLSAMQVLRCVYGLRGKDAEGMKAA